MNAANLIETQTNGTPGEQGHALDGQDGLRGVLEKNGLRYTQQRRLVYEFMEEARLAHVHPTAEMVFQAVKPRIPSISLATVYKSLEALEDCGLVQKLRLACDSAVYDGRVDSHHHALCLDSAKIYDVECSNHAALLALLVLPKDFTVERVHMDIEGYCADCGLDHAHDFQHSARGKASGTLRNSLEENGLRFTQQRQQVHHFMRQAWEQGLHPTAEEVFQGVKPTMLSISLATVYKSLEALEECGLLRKLKFGEHTAHFDFRTDGHHHAKCSVCGEISDIDARDEQALRGLMLLPEGFVVKRSHVSLVGRCGCARG